MNMNPLIRYSAILAFIFSAVYPQAIFAVDGVQQYGAIHQTWIDPSPSSPGIEFSNAIALHADTLVVSARRDHATVGVDIVYYVGAVYVYVLEENTWVLQTRLSPEDPASGDLFGSSVDIYGDTIVVGAVGSDSIDENGNDAPDMGAAYIFTRSGENWTQQAKIEPEDGIEDDNFGNAVSVVGERVVVGASAKDIGSKENAGKVYSYYRNGDKWYAAQTITAPQVETGAAFGSALDYDSSRVVIGAQNTNGNGAAYVFYRTGNQWSLESTLDVDDDQTGDNFSASVTIDSETIVVGAPFADPNLGSGDITNAGAAYVFRQAPGGWRQETKLVPENAAAFSQFGRFISIDDNRVIIGTTGNSIGNVLRAGSAYVYDRDGGEWPLLTQIFSADPYIDAGFGGSIIHDDNLIIIGEPGSATTNMPGRVHIYTLQEGVLPETGFVPNAVTELISPASAEANLGDLWISIPKLDLQTEIVFVPRQANSWNVSWLTTSVGHLDETAYPTHMGNSVLAGHANLPDGTDGPFAAIDQLQWGDQIIIHLDGYAYIYEVRDVFHTNPTDLTPIMKNENYDWLTLITCQGYDASTNSFNLRMVVVAVRIE